MSKPEFQVEEGDDTEIIDEEEFNAITKMREVKKGYRDAYEQVINFKPRLIISLPYCVLTIVSAQSNSN